MVMGGCVIFTAFERMLCAWSWVEGVGVHGLGSWVGAWSWVLGEGAWSWVLGARSWVLGAWSWVMGEGCMVLGIGCMVLGIGCMVLGIGCGSFVCVCEASQPASQMCFTLKAFCTQLFTSCVNPAKAISHGIGHDAISWLC